MTTSISNFIFTKTPVEYGPYGMPWFCAFFGISVLYFALFTLSESYLFVYIVVTLFLLKLMAILLLSAYKAVVWWLKKSR